MKNMGRSVFKTGLPVSLRGSLKGGCLAYGGHAKHRELSETGDGAGSWRLETVATHEDVADVAPSPTLPCSQEKKSFIRKSSKNVKHRKHFRREHGKMGRGVVGGAPKKVL